MGIEIGAHHGVLVFGIVQGCRAFAEPGEREGNIMFCLSG